MPAIGELVLYGAGRNRKEVLRGVDRTGVVAAVCRMEVDGWSEAEAEAEMKAFGFHEGVRDVDGH
jgi:hypothetical protein